MVGEQRDGGVQQRAVDALAEPGALALVHRRGDAERAEDAGGEVEEDTAERTGGLPGSPVIDMMPLNACISAS